MNPFISPSEIEEFNLRARCKGAERHFEIARTVQLGGVRVQFMPNAKNDLCLGKVVELNSDPDSLGLVRSSALVSSEKSSKDRSPISAAPGFLDQDQIQPIELENHLKPWQPFIVTWGVESDFSEDYFPGFKLVKACSAEHVLRQYDQADVAVLVLGSELEAIEIKEVLTRVVKDFPNNSSFNIVLNSGATAELFQDLVDDGRVFYLARGRMSEPQLRSTIVAAINCSLEKQRGGHDALVLTADQADRVLDFCIELSQLAHLEGADGLLATAGQSLIPADRVQLLIYDREDETLWSTKTPTREERRESAASGLVSYVARTGRSVVLERIGTDSCCDLEADDPGGCQDSPFMAQPIHDTNGAVIAVLTAARDANSPAFSPEDVRLFGLLAGCAAPALSAILLQSRIQNVLLERAQTPLQNSGIFRSEALDSNNLNPNQEGSLLPSLPRWLKASHLGIVVLVVAGLIYMTIAKVNEKATGPVLIRARNKIGIMGETTGLVRSVQVHVGERVSQGDLLVNLENTPGDTLLERFKKEVRAPAAGIVSDIRVRNGQQISPGDQIASIIDEGSGNELIALLPGSYAPQIHPGMALILKIQGYPDSHEIIPIETVANEVVGPHEAARYAGRESTDALDVTGPIVIVSSVLQQTTFQGDGRSLSYHDGMVGEAEVSVRKERMILSLIPGLKDLLKNPKKLISGE